MKFNYCKTPDFISVGVVRKAIYILLSIIIFSPLTVKGATESITENGLKYRIDTESEEAAITGCSKTIADLVIPESIVYNQKEYPVTSIGSSAFDGCSGLTSVTIPNSVTTIGNYAFYGCTAIKEITISDGDKTLSLGYNGSYEGLFYDSPLEKLYLGRNLSYNTSYGHSPFYNKTELTELTIGNSVTTIGGAAFAYCSGLTSVTIPNSVTTIGGAAFAYCI